MFIGLLSILLTLSVPLCGEQANCLEAYVDYGRCDAENIVKICLSYSYRDGCTKSTSDQISHACRIEDGSTSKLWI